MNLAAALPEPQDLADAIIAHEVGNHPHPRALARAFLRAASVAVAQTESDEAAANACFSRFARHRDRAASQVRNAGSRR